MAKASVIQTSFNAGEVSPLLEGRVDLGKYANSCHKLENFLPLVQGGTRKRSGTRFVKEVKDSSKFTRLLPFEFGTTQAYILEFGNLYMRVYRDGGAVLESSVNISGTTAASPVVVTTATAHEYATGDEIFIPATGGTGLAELDNKFWEIIVTSSTQFSLTGSPNPGATSSEGTVARVFTLVTPYPDTTLDSIQFAQSADVLYIAHPDFNPRKLQRTAHTAWSLSIIEFDWVPFEPQNVDSDVTVHTSAVTGTGQTLTASSPIFTDSMIGSQFKLAEIIGSNHGQWSSATPQTRSGYGVVVDTDDRYFENNVYLIKSISGSAGTSPPIHEFGIESDGKWTWEFIHSGAGYATITAVAGDGLTCTVDIDKRFPASVTGGSNATHRWAKGAWSGANGYPRTVSFFEDRLWWAGTDANPQTVWASKTSEYENHHVLDLDESALIFTLNTDQVNVIEWLNAGKSLLLGTVGGEFVVSAATETEALVPGNVRVVRHSSYGSRPDVNVLRVEQVVLFVQRSGRKLRELVFEDAIQQYVAPDMTILAEHITLGGGADVGIKRLAYAQEPDRIIWAALSDGNLIGFTYERAQKVTAWHRHTLGGSRQTGTPPGVESIATIHHPDADQDQLWMVVNRWIDGGTKRYIEYLESEWLSTNTLADAFFVDSGLTYSGSSTSTLSGLEHLEGETVAILGDGALQADKTVSGGAVTLDRAVTKAQVGLPYSATLQTMRLEVAGGQEGTAQGKTKRITNVVFRLYQTGSGLLYGPTDVDADMDELELRDASDAMDTALPLFDGDSEVLPWPEGYEYLGRVTLKHTKPLPCFVTALMAQVVTQDR
jgi:hypothetical protein